MASLNATAETHQRIKKLCQRKGMIMMVWTERALKIALDIAEGRSIEPEEEPEE